MYLAPISFQVDLEFDSTPSNTPRGINLTNETSGENACEQKVKPLEHDDDSDGDESYVPMDRG